MDHARDTEGWQTNPLTVLRMRIACSIGYLSYWIGTAAYVLTVVPLSFLAAPFGLQARFIGFTLRWSLFAFVRGCLPGLGIYRVKQTGPLQRSRTEGARIFVANHRGRLDGLLLLSVLRNTGAIMKVTYMGRPIYRILSKVFDFVSVDAHAPRSLQVSTDRCRRLLTRQRNLLVFPEGTRNATERLLPFRGLAFRLSVETGTPIVPVVLHSELPFMVKSPASYFPPHRFTYYLQPLEEIVPEPGEGPDRLAERTRRVMALAFDELRARGARNRTGGAHDR